MAVSLRLTSSAVIGPPFEIYIESLNLNAQKRERNFFNLLETCLPQFFKMVI